MPLTIFDAVVVGIVGLSAVLALYRGAVREILGLASWIGAGIAAVMALPVTQPLVRPLVNSDIAADALAVAGGFLVALIVLKLLTAILARTVEGIGLGSVDKLLGLAFGVARGALIICAGYLVTSYLIRPEFYPVWVQQAYLIEPVRQGAAALEQAIPPEYREEGRAAAAAAMTAAGESMLETAPTSGPTEEQERVPEQPAGRPPAPQR